MRMTWNVGNVHCADSPRLPAHCSHSLGTLQNTCSEYWVLRVLPNAPPGAYADTRSNYIPTPRSTCGPTRGRKFEVVVQNALGRAERMEV
jgi:hypothetical protein